MSNQWMDFPALRHTLRFAEVLRHYGIQAKMKGDRATAFCPLPQHPKRTDGSPRTASLSIHLGRNIFQCFGCKASGNVLDFACRMEGFDPSDPAQFRQGVHKVATAFRLSLGRADGDSEAPAEGKKAPKLSGSPPQASPSTTGPRRIVNAPLDFELKDLDPRHPYLRERGFRPETIEAFGLGYCNRGLMQGRVAIPLHDPAGRLVGYAGRITKDSMISDECPKYLLPGDRERAGVVHEFRKSHLLYNRHRIKGAVSNLIVVEGFPSTWWLWQAEYRDAVGLMGADCSERQGQLIVDLVKHDGTVWILSDGNQAGVDCARRVFERVAPHRSVRWVRLEKDEQPTDYSPDELAALFSGKIWIGFQSGPWHLPAARFYLY